MDLGEGKSVRAIHILNGPFRVNNYGRFHNAYENSMRIDDECHPVNAPHAFNWISSPWPYQPGGITGLKSPLCSATGLIIRKLPAMMLNKESSLGQSPVLLNLFQSAAPSIIPRCFVALGTLFHSFSATVPGRLCVRVCGRVFVYACVCFLVNKRDIYQILLLRSCHLLAWSPLVQQMWFLSQPSCCRVWLRTSAAARHAAEGQRLQLGRKWKHLSGWFLTERKGRHLVVRRAKEPSSQGPRRASSSFTVVISRQKDGYSWTTPFLVERLCVLCMCCVFTNCTRTHKACGLDVTDCKSVVVLCVKRQ